MSVVHELEIELTANAKKANTSIDNLVSKLDTLSGSLSKIDGSRLSGLANGVSKLGMATKTLSGVKATDYNRIAKGFERLAKIDTSKFSTLSSETDGEPVKYLMFNVYLFFLFDVSLVNELIRPL